MLVGRLEDTRFYQEAKAEGRKEGREEAHKEFLARVICCLLQREFSLEAIAKILKLPIEEVTQIAQQQPT
jgi:predicted transposase/invertase (TIGR01784 family)